MPAGSSRPRTQAGTKTHLSFAAVGGAFSWRPAVLQCELRRGSRTSNPWSNGACVFSLVPSGRLPD